MDVLLLRKVDFKKMIKSKDKPQTSSWQSDLR
jgi:hypothetical protein